MIEVRDAKPDDFPEADAMLSAGIAAGARVAVDSEGPICVWGCVEGNLLSDEGFVWLYPIRLDRAPRVRFLRECKRWLEGLNYANLVGTCECDNAVSFRWLKWLEFEPTGELVIEGRKVLRMERCNGY